ncbi:hypothetical protein AB0E08_08465 [Streptomyces sp. NPDC048281]|uniref:hypothetical protein n=1 Tax=Streptomyces sp. NPDC048281 TaxID=3154715 RepID=UPI00342D9651
MAEWSPIGGTLVSSAKGRSWREEAACWLLAESGPGSSHWPDRLQDAGLIIWEDQPDEDWDLAFVRWEALAVDLKQKDHDPADGLYGTDPEWVMLRFACALMTGKGGDWATDLPRVDHANRRILLGALAWAAGGEKAAYPYMAPEPVEPPPPPGGRRLRPVD